MSEHKVKQAPEYLNEQAIENHIRQGVLQETPDILDALLNELDLNPTPVENEAALPDSANSSSEPQWTDSSASFQAPSEHDGFMRETNVRIIRRPRRWYRAVLTAAAVLAIVAVGIFATRGFNQEVFALVDLDVNPSVELSVDKHERVVSASALNDDAVAVLDGLELEGTELNTACHAVVGSMLVKGYLRSDSNSILVSISALDSQAGKDLERQISENLNSYLENSEVAVAIWGQYVEGDDELAAFAETHGISLGKAWLIRKLLASSDAKMDETSLLKLSTQELILLAQDKKVENETSIGTSDASAFIPKEKAADIAFADAGVPKQDVGDVQVEFDCEDGELTYEVEFHAAGSTYEYDINARTGAILSTDVEAVEAAVPASGASAEQKAERDDDRDDADDADDDWDDVDDADDYWDDADDWKDADNQGNWDDRDDWDDDSDDYGETNDYDDDDRDDGDDRDDDDD